MASIPNHLFVEGVDDRAFVDSILRQHGFSKSRLAIEGKFAVESRGRCLQIHVCGGFDKIAPKLKEEYRPDEMDAIAIVADMDAHSEHRWQSIAGTLARAEFDYQGLPGALPSEGLVHRQPGSPTLGVWLMPDNVSEGMTETFAGRLLPADEPAWIHATDVVRTLPDSVRKFRADRDHEKALLHTWLAWQEEPGCRTGAAVTKRFLLADTEPAFRFMGWINRWLDLGADKSQ